jgi:hypothetical protein
VERGIEVADLLDQPVVAEQLAVIGRHHNERVVGLTGRVEVIEEPPELRVDLGHHPVVGRLELALFLLAVGGLDERVLDQQAEERMLECFVGA